MGKKVKVVFDTNIWISIVMEKILKDEFLQAKQKLTVYSSNDIILGNIESFIYPRIAEITKTDRLKKKKFCEPS